MDSPVADCCSQHRCYSYSQGNHGRHEWFQQGRKTDTETPFILLTNRNKKDYEAAILGLNNVIIKFLPVDTTHKKLRTPALSILFDNSSSKTKLIRWFSPSTATSGQRGRSVIRQTFTPASESTWTLTANSTIKSFACISTTQDLQHLLN